MTEQGLLLDIVGGQQASPFPVQPGVQPQIYRGRPCIVTGSSRARFKGPGRRWIHFTQLRVKFLDGQKPVGAAVGEGKFTAGAKGISGQQGAFWARVADLVQLSGLDVDRARSQAMTEVAGMVRE